MTNVKDTSPRQIDWDLIEADWRAGIKSQAQMAEQYGVSRAAMVKRFDKLGITRNLAPKIRDEAKTKVSKSIISAVPREQDAASEKEVVEANANLQSQIALAHRRDIQRARKLSMSLLDELESQTDHRDLIEQLGDALLADDDKTFGKRLEVLERLTSLAARSNTLKTLTDSLRSLVALERQAFGMDEEEGTSGSGVEDVIARILKKNGG
jgi:hypothetical protein